MLSNELFCMLMCIKPEYADKEQVTIAVKNSIMSEEQLNILKERGYIDDGVIAETLRIRAERNNYSTSGVFSYVPPSYGCC